MKDMVQLVLLPDNGMLVKKHGDIKDLVFRSVVSKSYQWFYKNDNKK